MFTSKLDEHDTQGWEQVERPKRRKSDKPSNSRTTTKLAETQITEQAKESSFKKLLEEIANGELMELGNIDIRADDDVDDDDVEMDTADIADKEEEDDADGVASAADEIEEFPDIIPRATHSYKMIFLTKTPMNMK